MGLRRRQRSPARQCRCIPRQESEILNDQDNQNDNQPADGEPRSQNNRNRRRRRRPGGQGEAGNQDQKPQQNEPGQPQRQQQASPAIDGNQQSSEQKPGGGQKRRRRRRRPSDQQQPSQSQPQAQPESLPQPEPGNELEQPAQAQRQQRQGRQQGQGRDSQQANRQGGRQGQQRRRDDNQQEGHPQGQEHHPQGEHRVVDGKNRRPMRRPRRDDEAPDRRPGPQRSRSQIGYSVVGPIGNDTLRVVPLGGVGEVGKNMTAVECGRDLVLLDAGGKFPEEDQKGIDLIVPDITFIMERLQNFRGILLTHGHEDHIGGLPHIIPQLKAMGTIPIWGTPLALGFVERKLIEARLEKFVELHEVKGGSRVKLGENIEAEFVHVTHSIPDACAIAIHTPVGTIMDTGDFKFDPTPVMGQPTDEKRLKRIGDDGVLALFSDTVRVEVEGSTPSERVVHDKIEEEIGKSKGQVIIATFASNVSRIHMALHAAEKHGRKVAVAGRSMEQNTRVALELGYLDPPDGLLVPLEEILRMPKEKRVIVGTGSQGEPAAALARIASGDHPKIRVSRGDTIIISATPIPGNEDTVSNTINNLFSLGCDVIYSALDRGVHVSGHAGREELQKMIKYMKPKYAVPIHGEYRHMALYRDLCTQTGIRRDHVLLPEIGGVIEFTRDSANQRGRVKAGSILVDRLGDRGDNQTVLRTRENLTDDGFVVVTIVLDRQSGELIAGPELTGKGLSKDLNAGALREAERELRRMMERRKQGTPQYGYVVQRAKETVGKVLYRRSRTRPLILPVVQEL